MEGRAAGQSRREAQRDVEEGGEEPVAEESLNQRARMGGTEERVTEGEREGCQYRKSRV